MPATIQAALEFPLVRDVESQVGREQLRRYIEFELVRVSQLVSVGGNLNDAQVQFVSDQLVSRYPNESIADFKLCFDRGITFRYGRIFRLDPLVIFEWMQHYLDEKYQVVEENLMKERDQYHRVQIQSDDSKAPLPLESEKAGEYIAKMIEAFKPKPRNMSENEIQRRKLETPYRWHNVGGVEIYATSQQHAEALARAAIERGEIEVVNPE